jgi:hypothetical protein
MTEFTCTDCNREFNSYKSLQAHNSRTHKIKGIQTFINMYHGGIHPKCKCGCDQELNYQNGKFGEYIRGHVARTNGGFYTAAGIDKSNETRRQQYKNGTRKQWNAGKQMTDEWLATYKIGWKKRGVEWKQSIREAKAKQLGYESWQHWYDTLPERKRYYYDVWRLTEANAHLIPGYDPELRGIAGTEGAYQIDHIIPISKGYADGIEPYRIAGPENLRFIPWQENLQKGNRT